MKIEKRTKSLKDVRTEEKVPGVLFGKSIKPVSIQIDEKDLRDLYKENGKTKTFEVKLGRKKHMARIRGIQTDVINRNHFLNVEMQKVAEGDTIEANLPVYVIGREGIERQGIVVQTVSDTIAVEYEVGKGVSNIEVDVSGMEIGDSIHVKDLKLPEGIKVVDDADKMVINVLESEYDEEELETAAEEEIEDMEVEAIKQKSEEDEDEESPDEEDEE